MESNISQLTHNKPFLAQAGADLHREAFEQLRLQFLEEGAIELFDKKDFIKFRDEGFSICRAIKDSNGKTLKVFDENNGRYMISIPDFVDYRKDIIIEFKTLHFSLPPDPEGIFATEIFQPPIPEGYEDATKDFKKFLETKCTKQYEAQFERYKLAYLNATGRYATLHVRIVPYAKVNH